MAITGNCVWEIRTTGSQNNGGGYVDGGGGVDYSQQDAAQYNDTNLAIDAVLNTKVTSASHNFVAADVGNIIHITAGTGFTAGWYEIKSVASNAATLDRACGNIGSTGGTFYVGGAFLIGGALDDEWHDAITAGNTIYIASGTYTLAENVIPAGSGSSATIVTWKGYVTNRETEPFGTDRPLLNAGAYVYTIVTYSYAFFLRFTTTNASGILANASLCYRCSFLNTSTTADRVAFAYGRAIECEIVSSYGTAYSSGTSQYPFLLNCYIHDSKTGVNTANYGNFSIVGCVIESCFSVGVNFASNKQVRLFNCTIRACLYGIYASDAYDSSVVSCIISDCVYGAYWTSAIQSNYWDYNCWNNTTDVTLVIKGPNDITADPLLASSVASGSDGATNSAPGTTFTAASNPFAGADTNDCLLITDAGTGATLGAYAISSVDGIGQLTLATSPGASKTGIGYLLVKGKDFTLGSGSPCFNTGSQPGAECGL